MRKSSSPYLPTDSFDLISDWIVRSVTSALEDYKAQFLSTLVPGGGDSASEVCRVVNCELETSKGVYTRVESRRDDGIDKTRV